MSSSEQRPTDEVEDDRGGRIPDDTEGHAWRHGQDLEAADDTEGHSRHLQDAEAADEDQAGDDTEGHSGHARI